MLSQQALYGGILRQTLRQAQGDYRRRKVETAHYGRGFDLLLISQQSHPEPVEGGFALFSARSSKYVTPRLTVTSSTTYKNVSFTRQHETGYAC